MKTKILLVLLFVGLVFTTRAVGVDGNLRPASLLDEWIVDDNCIYETEFSEKKEDGWCDWDFEENEFFYKDTYVRVQWAFKSHITAPIKYQVLFRTLQIGSNTPEVNPQFKFQKLVISKANVVQYEFENLTASSRYEVKLVSVNCGLESKQIIFSTLKDPTIEVPIDQNCIPDWDTNAIHGTTTSNSIKINWPSGGASAFYFVEYKRDYPNEGPRWIRSNAEGITSTSRYLPNLEADKGYDVRVIRVCTGNPDQVITGHYNTEKKDLGDCWGIWNGIRINDTSEDIHSVRLVWGKVKAARYNVWYRENSLHKNPWIYSGTTGGGSWTVRGLEKSTDYDFKVQYTCEDNNSQVSTASFRTRCCPNQIATCKAVSGLTHSNVTQFSAVIGFQDFNPGNLNTYELLTFHWEDEYGDTFSEPNFPTGSTSQKIRFLKPNTNYTYWITKECSAVVGIPTTEKGTFKTLPFTKCPKPTSLALDYVNYYDGKVVWDKMQGATNYTVASRVKGTSDWVTFSVEQTNYPSLYSTLADNTTYEVAVRSNCTTYNLPSSGWTNIYTFTTPSACPIPQGLRTDYVNSYDAKVMWSGAVNAQSYTLRVSINDGPYGYIENIYFPEFYSPNMAPGWKYSIAVRNNCTYYASDGFSEPITFWTPGLSANKSGNNTEIKSSKTIVYPNTNNGDFMIKYKKGKVVKSMSIYDAYGIKVFSKKYNARSGVEKDEFNLSYKLKSGVYKVRIQTDEGVEYETLLVEH